VFRIIVSWITGRQHPYKKDPSDSVPEPLRQNYHPDTMVDVFFIYPLPILTVKKHWGLMARLIMPVSMPGPTIQPFYCRPAFLMRRPYLLTKVPAGKSFGIFPRNAADSSEAIAAFELAYRDVKAAFLYYLEHNNSGRPIIIASHSQGSTHAKRLLKELFDGKPFAKATGGCLYNWDGG